MSKLDTTGVPSAGFFHYFLIIHRFLSILSLRLCLNSSFPFQKELQANKRRRRRRRTDPRNFLEFPTGTCYIEGLNCVGLLNYLLLGSCCPEHSSIIIAIPPLSLWFPQPFSFYYYYLNRFAVCTRFRFLLLTFFYIGFVF